MTSPTADTSVRVAWGDDAEAIARVQRACWANELPEAADALDAEAVAAAWHHALTRPPDARHRILVALERNRVVGFAALAPAQDPDCDPIRDGELLEWQVHPDERRQGHGSRLIHAAVDTLRADRFTRTVIWLHAGDDARMSYLRECGWAADGAHRELADEQGNRLKQVRWHTTLAAE